MPPFWQLDWTPKAWQLVIRAKKEMSLTIEEKPVNDFFSLLTKRYPKMCKSFLCSNKAILTGNKKVLLLNCYH
jgi:hypothetical protein